MGYPMWWFIGIGGEGGSTAEWEPNVFFLKMGRPPPCRWGYAGDGGRRGWGKCVAGMPLGAISRIHSPP